MRNNFSLHVVQIILKLSVSVIFLVPAFDSMAQEADYYRMEIGCGAGMWNYFGDFNGKMLKGFQPKGSVMLKYLPDEHMAFKLDLSVGKMKSDYNRSDNYFPLEQYSFSSTVYDVSFMYEYNFWRHGMSGDYRHLYRLVPYIALGIGFSYVNGNKTELLEKEKYNCTSFNFPVGIGVKYKIGERLNCGLEYLYHLTSSDKFDGYEDPYGIKSSGLFKNTDSFGELKLYITYSFMAKCRQCNN